MDAEKSQQAKLALSKASGGFIKPPAKPVTHAPTEAKMTKEQKKILGRDIRQLNQKYLIGIVPIVKGDDFNKGSSLEFDINTLSPEKTHRLRKYVDECLDKMRRGE